MPSSAKSLKSVRMSGDAQRLLKLLAAYEDRPEGDIMQDALSAYLSVRSLSYGDQLPEARELSHATPASVGDAVQALTAAIAQVVDSGGHGPKPGDGKARLKSRAGAQALEVAAPAGSAA